MRRASFLRSFALRCSPTASAVPVTVGMEAMDRRPRTISCVSLRSRRMCVVKGCLYCRWLDCEDCVGGVMLWYRGSKII